MPTVHKSSSSPLGLTTYTDDNTTTKIGNYGPISPNSGVKSLFSKNSKKGNSQFVYGSESNHTISVEDIVEYAGDRYPSMKLTYADFAYLTKLGVYPNNRLIIARRFESPVGDDLTAVKGNSPMATLISWVEDNKDFLTLDYGEEWASSTEGSFKKVLNDIGNDVLQGDNKGKDLGSFLEKGINAIPLPGFSEGLQYEVFHALGMTDLDSTKLPLGNPNLIRESMRRTTIDKESTGSGLKGKFKITMEVEYEQKFISGVDPTTIYYDIIANALAFGTSESVFQFRSDTGIGAGFKSWLDDLGSGDSSRVRSAIVQFVGALSSSIKAIGKAIVGVFKNENDAADRKSKQDEKGQKNQAKKDKRDKDSKIINLLKNIALGSIAGIVSKYKVRIVAVANAMTGTPSAPWHVTIGNPKRPILSTGDMVCESVELTLGKVLAFNDLPSSIKIKVTFASARNLGLQEIFKKLSCGGGRVYETTDNNLLDKRKSFVEESFNPTQEDLEAAEKVADNNRKVADAKTAADKAAKDKEEQDKNRNNPQPK